jgi:hypothetical protein
MRKPPVSELVDQDSLTSTTRGFPCFSTAPRCRCRPRTLTYAAGIIRRHLKGDLAAPQARAVPVALRVAAGAAVLEGDAVFAGPAPGDSHGDSLPPWWGQLVVTTASLS